MCAYVCAQLRCGAVYLHSCNCALKCHGQSSKNMSGDCYGLRSKSQEWVKLRTSNLAGTFTGPSEEKPIKNVG